jgi:hypothetical protein
MAEVERKPNTPALRRQDEKGRKAATVCTLIVWMSVKRAQLPDPNGSVRRYTQPGPTAV